MFRYFETRIDPTATPAQSAPPPTLLAFYWFYVRQAKGPFAALFGLGFALALIEALVPYFVGRLVLIFSKVRGDEVFTAAGPTLAIIAVIILVVRPLGTILSRLIGNHALAISFTSLVTWQSYWHVVRQPISFFNSELAGRIANHVLQTARPLRETVIAVSRTIWQISIFGVASIGLLASQDLRLAAPMLIWFMIYAWLLVVTLPKLQKRSHDTSKARSTVSGKIVDSFTNITTVKLFGRQANEDSYIRDSFLDFFHVFSHQQRLNTLYAFGLTMLNAVFLVSIGGLAVRLFSQGQIDAGALTTALLLTTQVIGMSGGLAYEIMAIFENVGTVQEGMRTIARPDALQDRPDTRPLALTRGEICFKAVRFAYQEGHTVIDGLDLTIRAGERVGLVGRSGAGKTTLTNLLLRLYEPQEGRILIDGQDIADVTEESLRAQISVVTQDPSLLHRSIGENILYGRPDAGEAAMREAARQAQAETFIERLKDSKDRVGFSAHVGERGVKLSGGQRQRIALARLILKDAPILVLDEATAALDSEAEAAVQDALGPLMEGKTVIAIAHRLSTLQRMDRIVVLDRGRIVEEGTHAALLGRGGLYADLWAHQSGHFLVPPRRRVRPRDQTDA